MVHLEQERDVRRILIADGVATELPLTNWKDPRYANRPTQTKSSVESFLTWAQSRYPGRQRLVVLWGHSRGVGIDFVGPSGLAVDVPETSTGGVPSPTGPSPDGLAIPDLIDAITPAVSPAGQVAPKDCRPIDVLASTPAT